MYIPAHFAAPDLEACHRVIREHPFALLATGGADGDVQATPIPFVLDPALGARGTLLGHVARGNPLAKEIDAGRRATVLFAGPHGYVSPRAYVSSPQVPTWNYVAVHAYGVLVPLDDEGTVSLLARLAATFEGDAPDAWTLDAAPEAFIRGLVRGIRGFTLAIDRIEGKLKLSQNRAPEDAAGAARFLAASADAESRATAVWMRRLGIGG